MALSRVRFRVSPCGFVVDRVTMMMIRLWVRARTVPMHLIHINGPFLPHNLISAQENPVSLLEVPVGPQT
jgi:hypothetical protein